MTLRDPLIYKPTGMVPNEKTQGPIDRTVDKIFGDSVQLSEDEGNRIAYGADGGLFVGASASSGVTNALAAFGPANPFPSSSLPFLVVSNINGEVDPSGIHLAKAFDFTAVNMQGYETYFLVCCVDFKQFRFPFAEYDGNFVARASVPGSLEPVAEWSWNVSHVRPNSGSDNVDVRTSFNLITTQIPTSIKQIAIDMNVNNTFNWPLADGTQKTDVDIKFSGFIIGGKL